MSVNEYSRYIVHETDEWKQKRLEQLLECHPISFISLINDLMLYERKSQIVTSQGKERMSCMEP